MILIGYAIGYGLPYLIEVFIGTWMFSMGFSRKENFKKRLSLSILTELIISVFCCYIYLKIANNILGNMILYTLLFFISMIYLKNCFDESIVAIIDCGISAYLCQHVVSQIMQTIRFNNFKDIESIEVITAKSIIETMMLFTIELVVVAICYYLAFILFAKPLANRSERETNSQMLLLSIVTIVIVVVLSSCRDFYAGESFKLMLISRLFSIFSCILLMIMKSGMVESNSSKEEQRLLNIIHAKEIEQYENQKKEMELINIKCHDMRHRIERLEKQQGNISKDEINEVRSLINIYDYSIKTGNDALDMILAEHSLSCNEYSIKLSTIADGKALDFMSEADIYALFDNAIGNAINAVIKLENSEDRIITISVRQVKEMVCILIENPYVGNIVLKGGIPQTSEEDKQYHGFGMKSIEMVTKKYGGTMVVKTDTVYSLSIMLPKINQM